MNIKEHIEAGHYPVDGKGRALVPMRNGGTATIVAIDAPGHMPIVAFHPETSEESSCSIYWPDGSNAGLSTAYNGYNLLPPEPRKVKVTRWAIIERGSGYWCTYKSREAAVDWLDRLGYPYTQKYELVELTGEYEQPWEPAPLRQVRA